MGSMKPYEQEIDYGKGKGYGNGRTVIDILKKDHNAGYGKSGNYDNGRCTGSGAGRANGAGNLGCSGNCFNS